jgi:hypothetical protein
LFINQIGNKKHWVGLRLVMSGSTNGRQHLRRDALGAVVQIGSAVRRVASDGSYASASDPRVLVGLGANATLPPVQVTWPDGRVERWSSVAVDRYTTLEEGTGR